VKDQDQAFTSGRIFTLVGGAISWTSKKQSLIASSTMESEFIALALASKEGYRYMKYNMRYHCGLNQ